MVIVRTSGEKNVQFPIFVQHQVTQYSCDFNNLAPDGCTQYYFGPQQNSALVRTYNYDNGMGRHLAEQDQNICIRWKKLIRRAIRIEKVLNDNWICFRRERSNCRICWTVVNDIDFRVSGIQIKDFSQ